MRYFLALPLLLSSTLALAKAPSPVAATASNQKPADALSRLAADCWEETLLSSPETATFFGDHRFDDKLSDLGEPERLRHLAAAKDLKRRLLLIPTASLDDQQRITAEILGRKLDEIADGDRFRFERYAVDQLDGPQVSFAQLIQEIHPRRDPHDLDTLYARLVAFPQHLADYTQRLREGLEHGQVAPALTVKRVIAELDDLEDKKVIDVSMNSIGAKSPDDKGALRWKDPEAVARAVRAIDASFSSLRGFLAREYLPKARPSDAVGIYALPDGEAAYAYLIRVHTTTDRTPKELHALGLDKLKEIEVEMAVIARRAGFSDVKSYADSLRREGEPATPAETLLAFRAILARTEARLPDYFGTLPKIGYSVEAMPSYMEKDSPAAYYNQPTEDGARKGIFYVNTYHSSDRPRSNMAALAAHEAVPGHHLQIAIAYGLADLPKVRRLDGFTAFIEGWALYAERLADEMGLYQNDAERFGMLAGQAWRASRLVVDTGMHALKWSREQAVAFLLEHSALPRFEVENEVDRYITWPGQALAYMVGEQEIFAARDEARRKLGAAFSLKAFHDRVLSAGPLPISTLRRRVSEWADSAAVKPAQGKREGGVH